MHYRERAKLSDLFADYNPIESILANIGLESLVIFLRAKRTDGVTVQGSNERGPNDYPLSPNDYE